MQCRFFQSEARQGGLRVDGSFQTCSTGGHCGGWALQTTVDLKESPGSLWDACSWMWIRSRWKHKRRETLEFMQDSCQAESCGWGEISSRHIQLSIWCGQQQPRASRLGKIFHEPGIMGKPKQRQVQKLTHSKVDRQKDFSSLLPKPPKQSATHVTYRK